VPTATSHVRERGYDQARLLAREISRQGRYTYLDCLSRVGQTRQVGASRERRQRQLRGVFRASVPDRVQNRLILLVDDVATTGSTLEIAAYALKSAGVRNIEALVFARA
jgi:ComF family protein